MTTSKQSLRERCRTAVTSIARRVAVLRGPGTTTGGTTGASGTGVAVTNAVVTDGGPDDRGDVPGWVLVTLMTAGLVSALWLVAGDALVNLFQTAISHVAP